MRIEKLEEILKNQPSFRLKQCRELIYQKLITNWQEASNLPINIRAELNKECPLEISAEIFKANDCRSEKARITLFDNNKIECVLMRHKDNRNTVCVSSQVGCSMKCAFCATGKLGFTRNLTVYEIIEQVILFERVLKKEGQKISNVVFMGMGEPFLNYINLLKAIAILNDKDKFNISSRKISISTCGIVDGINKISREKFQVNLAVSLHAPNNNIRSELMPINKVNTIEKILKAVDHYIKVTNRQVMIEYIMLDNMNDTVRHARELSQILNKYLTRLYIVNLITYNQTGRYKASKVKAVEEFANTLRKHGIKTTKRFRFGTDIAAACGQLAGST